MTEFATLMRANLAEIDRLRRRVDETAAWRDRSDADRQTWADACRQFHLRFDQLAFPGGAAQWAAFLAGKSRGIDAAVAFLDVDPWFLGSGYVKEIIWHRLKRFPLGASRVATLESIALAWLRRRVRREFWAMARCLRAQASAPFWDAVAALATPQHGTTGLRAHWLQLAHGGAPVRHWVNAEVVRRRDDAGYVPDFWFTRQGPDDAWLSGGQRLR